ncbi:Uncharacterised protein [Escherichia coli]|uniref:Uncharacterized protein n=1 Tax=Escherichia coli TaxID=562 RepID=A0A2X1LCH0_ECOLX|nr:Uncharacterised protein [Escherichia coli]
MVTGLQRQLLAVATQQGEFVMSEQQYTRLLKNSSNRPQATQSWAFICLAINQARMVRESSSERFNAFQRLNVGHKKGGQPTRLIRGQRLLETIKFVIPLFHINPVLKS